MQKISSFFDKFSQKYLSSSKQVQRIIILAVIALVLVVGSFAGYYYFDRYYSNQQTVEETTLEEAEQAVNDNPTDLNLRQVLAEKYLLYRRYDDAISQAKQVFTSDPTMDRSWLVIGVASNLMGNYQDAISPLTNFVDKYKDEEMAGLDKALQEAVYYLGESYLQMKDYENAIKYLEMSVGWSQLDADAMYKLALAYKAVGRNEDAVNTLHLAVNFVPNFTEAYQAMAEAYDAGNLQDLGDYARGMVAYSQKDNQTALDYLLKSAEKYPSFAPIFAGLGLTYEALEDLENARLSFETALAIDPESFTASRGLERVNALLEQ